MPRKPRVEYEGAIYHPPSLKLRRDKCDEPGELSGGDMNRYAISSGNYSTLRSEQR
jgi:hypothetical protein